MIEKSLPLRNEATLQNGSALHRRPRQATSGLGALLKAASDEKIIALEKESRIEVRESAR